MPDFRIPLGFAGSLHDPDLGFVRFGWRDKFAGQRIWTLRSPATPQGVRAMDGPNHYDPFTGRWTASDPLGDAGGDPAGFLPSCLFIYKHFFPRLTPGSGRYRFSQI